MQRYNLVVNRAQITDSLEVFAASRSPVVCETSVAFDSKNTDGLQSEPDLGCPDGAFTLEQMSNTFTPATDMKANGEAQKCVDDALAQKVETNEPADLATELSKSAGGDTWV